MFMIIFGVVTFATAMVLAICGATIAFVNGCNEMINASMESETRK